MVDSGRRMAMGRGGRRERMRAEEGGEKRKERKRQGEQEQDKATEERAAEHCGLGGPNNHQPSMRARRPIRKLLLRAGAARGENPVEAQGLAGLPPVGADLLHEPTAHSTARAAGRRMPDNAALADVRRNRSESGLIPPTSGQPSGQPRPTSTCSCPTLAMSDADSAKSWAASTEVGPTSAPDPRHVWGGRLRAT